MQDIYAQLNIASASSPLEIDLPDLQADDDGLTVESALSGPDAVQWRAAMDAEFASLQINAT